MAKQINGQPAAVACEVSPEQGLMNLTFADGRKLNLHVSGLSEAIRAAAMMHGLKQKLVDAAAINRDPETGKPATIQTKYDAVREVFDRITSANGTWNKVRGDGTGTTGAGGLLYRALVRLYAEVQTPEQVRAYLTPLTAEQQAALRKNKKIAPVIEAIKVEDAERRREQGEDDEDVSDALLAGLGDLPE